MRKFAAALALAAGFTIVPPIGSTFAQNEPSSIPVGKAPEETSHFRFIQQFVTDASIVSKQWYGIEFRLQNGAVPPIENADGFLLTPTVAVSLFKNVEVGGQVSYISFDLDDEINVGGASFDGESGLGDLTIWGKYQLASTSTLTFTGGAFVDLPTGAEDQGLGTGKVVPGLFAAVRVPVGDGHFLGQAGLRFNRDATILDQPLGGKTSTSIGGGFIWEAPSNWVLSGEVTVESARFEDGDSDFRATAGAQYIGWEHSLLRTGIGIGLSDAAPDFELIVGYAYTF